MPDEKPKKRRKTEKRRKSHTTSLRLTIDHRVFLSAMGGPAKYIRECINRDIKIEKELANMPLKRFS